MSALVACGGIVSGLIAAAFRSVTTRLDADEKDISALKQAHADSVERLARVDRKMDDLTDTVHSIDKNIAALVAQGQERK